MGKRKITEAIVLSCVLGVGTVSAQAASTPLSLFNTGVDPSGKTLANGATDPNYFILSYPGSPTPPPATPLFVAINNIPTTYIPADPVGQSGGSEWISGPLINQGSQSPGLYDYRTLFFVPTNYDGSTAQITGKIAADNSVTIELNGIVEQSITNPESFTSYSNFSITNPKDFHAGQTNFIDFVVDNLPVSGPNPDSPQGLRVDGISGSVSTGVGSAVPEPASLISCLMGIGLVAAGMVARRRWLAEKA